jgi:hypothetical protein
MAASSTATVKWYSGVPSERTITRSPPRALVSISTWPRTMSSKAILRSAGMRKRTTGLRPSASNAARSAGVRLAQRPLYRAASRAASWRLRSASSSAGEQ